MTDRHQQEVDQNYEVFERLLPTIVKQFAGKFALMKDGKIRGYYSSAEDASEAGTLAFEDGLFSVQHVSEQAIHLGFYTDAVLSVHVQSSSGADHTGSGLPV